MKLRLTVNSFEIVSEGTTYQIETARCYCNGQLCTSVIS